MWPYGIQDLKKCCKSLGKVVHVDEIEGEPPQEGVQRVAALVITPDI